MFISLDLLFFMLSFKEPTGSELIDGVFQQFAELRQQLNEGIQKNNKQVAQNNAQINRLHDDNLALDKASIRARELDERLADLVG